MPEVAAKEQTPPVEEPARFEIDGVVYPVPLLDELDLDEEEILWQISGIIQSDFIPAHPESPADVRAAVDLAIAVRIRNPAFKRALAMIAYRRGNPDVPLEEIGKLIGTMNALDAELALRGKERAPEEDEPDPTSSSSEST